VRETRMKAGEMSFKPPKNSSYGCDRKRERFTTGEAKFWLD
jgi:hypothetical protein